MNNSSAHVNGSFEVAPVPWPSWATLVLGVVVLTSGTGCPSVHEQCVTSVSASKVRPELEAAQVSECERDPTLRAWLACRPYAKSFEEVAACARRAEVSFPTSRRPSRGPNGLGVLASAACAGPTSTLPAAPAAPTFKQTPYRPSTHGFRFANQCEHSPGVKGCCEGMSYGSLDYYRRGLATPIIAQPAPGLPDWNALEGWVKARQREEGWTNASTFVSLTAENPIGKYDWATRSWPAIKASLDKGEPVLIGLAPMTAWVWEAHAMVAWGYAEDVSTPGQTRKYLQVYDPNDPGEDRDWLENIDDGKPGSTWREYASLSCVWQEWSTIGPLAYENPGRQAEWKVPDLLTAGQIRRMPSAFIHVNSAADAGRFLRAGVEFPIASPAERAALGGASNNIIELLQPDFAPLTCAINPAACKPSNNVVYHEVFSGRNSTVDADGSSCPSTGFGALVPDGALKRFPARPECSHVIGPVVLPGVSGVHHVTVRFQDVDDEAFVWVGAPGRNEDAICSARLRDGGNSSCDITRRLTGGNRTVLTFKVGNSGGLGSKAEIFLDIDGRQVWYGREIDNAWKHTGWTFRAQVAVDVINGTAAPLGEAEACVTIFDCMN